MELLNNDLTCMEFIHISRKDLETTKYIHGILFVPGKKTGGGCWSALGRSPGFTNGNGPIDQWGAPSIGCPDEHCPNF